MLPNNKYRWSVCCLHIDMSLLMSWNIIIHNVVCSGVQWWDMHVTKSECRHSAIALGQQSDWVTALCGLRGCKNWPAPFPGSMSYKVTKPGLVSVLYLSMRYMVLLLIRAHFYVLLVFVAMCSVFWLFWLSHQSLPIDWLERLLWGSLIVARGSSPESPGRRVRMIFLVYCIASLFYYVFVLSHAPMWHFPTVMAYLCWKCP